MGEDPGHEARGVRGAGSLRGSRGPVLTGPEAWAPGRPTRIGNIHVRAEYRKPHGGW